MRRQAARREDPFDQRAPSSDQHPESRDPAAELFGQAFTVSDMVMIFQRDGTSMRKATSSWTPRAIP